MSSQHGASDRKDPPSKLTKFTRSRRVAQARIRGNDVEAVPQFNSNEASGDYRLITPGRRHAGYGRGRQRRPSR